MRLGLKVIAAAAALPLLTGATPPTQPYWIDVTAAPYSAACDWNGTTGTDDHVAIQNALNSGKQVYFPRFCYVGTSKLTFGNVAFATMFGDGPNSSGIVSAATSVATIEVAAAIPGLSIKGLMIFKPSGVTALSAADGIKYLGYEDTPLIENVEIVGHYVGINASTTLDGNIRRVYIHGNASHCMQFANPTIVNDFQWNLDDIDCQSNTGQAGIWTTGSNAALGAKSSMGQVNNFRAFNTGGGLKFVGNATVPLQAPRVLGGFLGLDGGPELSFDLYNTGNPYPVEVIGTYMEATTSGPCVDSRPTRTTCRSQDRPQLTAPAPAFAMQGQQSSPARTPPATEPMGWRIAAL